MIGATRYCCRKLIIDEWLFRACKATNKSYALPSYVCDIETWLPRRLRMVAQRSAVMRLPWRESGGAGVTIPIFIFLNSAAHTCGSPPIHRDDQACRNFDSCYELGLNESPNNHREAPCDPQTMARNTLCKDQRRSPDTV